MKRDNLGMVEKRISLRLDEQLYTRLKAHAARQGTTLAALIKAWLQEKVTAGEPHDSAGAADPAWQNRFQRLMEKMHSGVPAGMTAEEIEHEITLARAEARELRRARRP